MHEFLGLGFLLSCISRSIDFPPELLLPLLLLLSLAQGHLCDVQGWVGLE